MKKDTDFKPKKNLQPLPSLDELKKQKFQKELAPLDIIKKEKDSEIDPLDLINEKIDINMNTLVDQSITIKVTNNKTFKKIVDSPITESLNQKIQPKIKKILEIIGRIYISIGIIFILYSLILFNQIDQTYTGRFRSSVYSLIFFVSALLIFFTGLGVLKQKKWIIGLMTLNFIISIIACIFSIIPKGNLGFGPYENFGGNLVNLIINFLLLIILFKNRNLFND